MSRKSEAIREMRESIFKEQGGTCWGCGGLLQFDDFELAHLIPQRKWCLRLWGVAVIHHRLNLVGTHRGFCNSKVQLDPESTAAEILADKIEEAICGESQIEKRT